MDIIAQKFLILKTEDNDKIHSFYHSKILSFPHRWQIKLAFLAGIDETTSRATGLHEVFVRLPREVGRIARYHIIEGKIASAPE